MYATDIKETDNRPIAFLLATAYPELWAAFVARCAHENQFQELDPRLLDEAPKLSLVA